MPVIVTPGNSKIAYIKLINPETPIIPKPITKKKKNIIDNKIYNICIEIAISILGNDLPVSCVRFKYKYPTRFKNNIRPKRYGCAISDTDRILCIRLKNFFIVTLVLKYETSINMIAS